MGKNRRRGHKGRKNKGEVTKSPPKRTLESPESFTDMLKPCLESCQAKIDDFKIVTELGNATLLNGFLNRVLPLLDFEEKDIDKQRVVQVIINFLNKLPILSEEALTKNLPVVQKILYELNETLCTGDQEHDQLLTEQFEKLINYILHVQMASKANRCFVEAFSEVQHLSTQICLIRKQLDLTIMPLSKQARALFIHYFITLHDAYKALNEQNLSKADDKERIPMLLDQVRASGLFLKYNYSWASDSQKKISFIKELIDVTHECLTIFLREPPESQNAIEYLYYALAQSIHYLLCIPSDISFKEMTTLDNVDVPKALADCVQSLDLLSTIATQTDMMSIAQRARYLALQGGATIQKHYELWSLFPLKAFDTEKDRLGFINTCIDALSPTVDAQLTIDMGLVKTIEQQLARLNDLVEVPKDIQESIRDASDLVYPDNTRAFGPFVDELYKQLRQDKFCISSINEIFKSLCAACRMVQHHPQIGSKEDIIKLNLSISMLINVFDSMPSLGTFAKDFLGKLQHSMKDIQLEPMAAPAQEESSGIDPLPEWFHAMNGSFSLTKENGEAVIAAYLNIQAKVSDLFQHANPSFKEQYDRVRKSVFDEFKVLDKDMRHLAYEEVVRQINRYYALATEQKCQDKRCHHLWRIQDLCYFLGHYLFTKFSSATHQGVPVDEITCRMNLIFIHTLYQNIKAISKLKDSKSIGIHFLMELISRINMSVDRFKHHLKHRNLSDEIDVLHFLKQSALSYLQLLKITSPHDPCHQSLETGFLRVMALLNKLQNKLQARTGTDKCAILALHLQMMNEYLNLCQEKKIEPRLQISQAQSVAGVDDVTIQPSGMQITQATTQLARQVIDLKKQLSEIQTQRQSQEEILKQSHQKEAKLQSEKEQSDQALSEASKENLMHLQSIDGLKRHVKRLKQELKSSARQKHQAIKAKEDELIDLKAQCADLMETIGELKADFLSKTRALDRSQSEHQRIQEAFERQKQKSQQAKDESIQLRHDVSQLEKQLAVSVAEKSASESRLDEIESQLAKNQDEMCALRQQLEDLTLSKSAPSPAPAITTRLEEQEDAFRIERSLNYRLPKDVFRTIDIIQNAGFKVYLVGGGVRDALLDTDPRDFDFVTTCPIERFKELLPYFNQAHRFKWLFSSGLMDFKCDPELDLSVDALQRDWTVNALYLSIRKEGHKGQYACQVYDPLKRAYDDLLKRKLITVKPIHESLSEDPARLLRGLKLMLDLKCHFPMHEAYIKHYAKSLTQYPFKVYVKLINRLFSGKSGQQKAHKLMALAHNNVLDHLFIISDFSDRRLSVRRHQKYMTAHLDRDKHPFALLIPMLYLSYCAKYHVPQQGDLLKKTIIEYLNQWEDKCFEGHQLSRKAVQENLHARLRDFAQHISSAQPTTTPCTRPLTYQFSEFHPKGCASPGPSSLPPGPSPAPKPD